MLIKPFVESTAQAGGERKSGMTPADLLEAIQHSPCLARPALQNQRFGEEGARFEMSRHLAEDFPIAFFRGAVLAPRKGQHSLHQGG